MYGSRDPLPGILGSIGGDPTLLIGLWAGDPTLPSQDSQGTRPCSPGLNKGTRPLLPGLCKGTRPLQPAEAAGPVRTESGLLLLASAEGLLAPPEPGPQAQSLPPRGGLVPERTGCRILGRAATGRPC